MAKHSPLALPGDGKDDPLHAIYRAIERFISKVPKTDEPKSKRPKDRARFIANTAAAKAAAVSAGLALPPGPLGILTIVPDLLAIWKIQAQMVADIAGTFGKKAYLTREQMLYCLFKHAAAQAVRDLVVRTGERILVRRVSLRTMQGIVKKIAPRITQRLIGKAISRWFPLLGALGVGAYAFYDTAQVGNTAIDLFKRKIRTQKPN
jgi:hypothetical protein